MRIIVSFIVEEATIDKIEEIIFFDLIIHQQHIQLHNKFDGVMESSFTLILHKNMFHSNL